MTKQNIIIFIPIDTSILATLPNFKEDLNKHEVINIQEDLLLTHEQAYYSLLPVKDEVEYKQAADLYEVEKTEAMVYDNQDLIYDPNIKEEDSNPFQMKENKENYDYQSAFLQYRECNKRLEWPISTTIHCKLDCHPFTGRPWYLPYDYIEGVYVVHPHVFCSPECALGWNLVAGGHNHSKYSSLLYLLVRTISKQKDVHIEPAYEQNMLQIFGGPLNIEDFRNKHKDYLLNKVELVYPEILTIIPIIKRYNQTQENNGQQDKPGGYKLKRTKQIERKTTTIMDTIVKKLHAK
jgi:hypothetical protein